jgi:ADP-ribose pyrophosphatase YjhB (NUDIX family)
MELRYHSQIAHPYGRPQLLADVGQHTPKVLNWYRGFVNLWYESYPLDTPQGAEIMDKMTQGQHLGTNVFKDLEGFPATHLLAKPPTTIVSEEQGTSVVAVTRPPPSSENADDDYSDGYTDESSEDEEMVDENANQEPKPTNPEKKSLPSNKPTAAGPVSRKATYVAARARGNTSKRPGATEVASSSDEEPDLSRRVKRIIKLKSVAREPRSHRARMERRPRASKSSGSWKGTGVVGFKWDYKNMTFTEARYIDPMVLIVTTKKGSNGFPKGKVELGETELVGALREWREESECSRQYLNISRNGTVMHQSVAYHAGHYIFSGKSTGKRYSWPVSDKNAERKQDIVKASWIPMSEIVEDQIVNKGRIKVMQECWHKVLNDKELRERAGQKPILSKEHNVRPVEAGATIRALLLGGKRGSSDISDQPSKRHKAESSGRASSSSHTEKYRVMCDRARPTSMDVNRARPSSVASYPLEVSMTKPRARPQPDGSISGLVRGKDGEHEEMIVDMVDMQSLVANIDNARVATRTHFDLAQNLPQSNRSLRDKAIEAGTCPPQTFAQICKAFNDDRGCTYPCINKFDKPSKEGNKAHVCDARIPVMPQWIYDLPAPDRFAENVHVKYKVCASTSHNRKDHFDHHDGVIMNEDGKCFWLVGQKSIGPDAGLDTLGRWAGVS